jgi:hypothetical protein
MGVDSHVTFLKRKGEGDDPSRLLDPQPEHVIDIRKRDEKTHQKENAAMQDRNDEQLGYDQDLQELADNIDCLQPHGPHSTSDIGYRKPGWLRNFDDGQERTNIRQRKGAPEGGNQFSAQVGRD